MPYVIHLQLKSETLTFNVQPGQGFYQCPTTKFHGHAQRRLNLSPLGAYGHPHEPRNQPHRSAWQADEPNIGFPPVLYKYFLHQVDETIELYLYCIWRHFGEPKYCDYFWHVVRERPGGPMDSDCACERYISVYLHTLVSDILLPKWTLHLSSWRERLNEMGPEMSR